MALRAPMLRRYGRDLEDLLKVLQRDLAPETSREGENRVGTEAETGDLILVAAETKTRTDLNRTGIETAGDRNHTRGRDRGRLRDGSGEEIAEVLDESAARRPTTGMITTKDAGWMYSIACSL